jgi:hypothetical protein
MRWAARRLSTSAIKKKTTREHDQQFDRTPRTMLMVAHQRSF